MTGICVKFVLKLAHCTLSVVLTYIIRFYCFTTLLIPFSTKEVSSSLSICRSMIEKWCFPGFKFDQPRTPPSSSARLAKLPVNTPVTAPKFPVSDLITPWDVTQNENKSAIKSACLVFHGHISSICRVLWYERKWMNGAVWYNRKALTASRSGTPPRTFASKLFTPERFVEMKSTNPFKEEPVAGGTEGESVERIVCSCLAGCPCNTPNRISYRIF